MHKFSSTPKFADLWFNFDADLDDGKGGGVRNCKG